MLRLAEAGGDDIVVHRTVWVYDEVWSKIVELRGGVKGFNVNRFWNDAALAYVAELDGAEEELRLEAEIDILIQSLDRVHRDQKAVLRHGSYALAYMKELKGLDVKRYVTDAPPYNAKHERPSLTAKELELVEKMVIYRRALAEELHEKLDKRMDLRGEGIDPKLVDRIRQSLKVGDIPRRSRRVPDVVDDLLFLPSGTGRITPEELYRMRDRSGDAEVDEALRQAWAVEDEIRRKREARLDAEEAEDP